MDLLSPVEALLSSVLWIETGCSSIVFLSLDSSADAPSVIQTYMGMPSQDSRMDLQSVLILPVAHFVRILLHVDVSECPLFARLLVLDSHICRVM